MEVPEHVVAGKSMPRTQLAASAGTIYMYIYIYIIYIYAAHWPYLFAQVLDTEGPDVQFNWHLARVPSLLC